MVAGVQFPELSTRSEGMRERQCALVSEVELKLEISRQGKDRRSEERKAEAESVMIAESRLRMKDVEVGQRRGRGLSWM